MDSSTKTQLAYAGAGVGAVALAYYATRREPIIDPLYDFSQQSIEIDPIEHIRVAKSAINKPLVEYRDENFRTLYPVLSMGLQVSGNGNCLGYRQNGKGPYIWLKYSDVIEQTKLVGSGLLNKGVKAENSTNIGIYSKNRPEWNITEYACYSYSMVTVSLYDSYGKASIKYILNQAEINAVFVDNYTRVLNIVHVINELPYLRLIVYFDEFTQDEIDKLQLPSNVELISFTRLKEYGKSDVKPPVPPKPSDVATLCYTSGTTGYPKGAMITHGNMIANEATGHERRHRPYIGLDTFNPTPVVYSYLPLAHMMGRMEILAALVRGGCIGFTSGDITKLPEDCQLLKPTNMTLVPRLINKLYERVKSEIGGQKMKWFLLQKGIAAKEADRKRGIIRQDTIYDKLIFKKIREIFGGNLMRTGIGSAPISKEVYNFARSVFSCPFNEGYGQTEATLVISTGHPLDPTSGHCGPPVHNFMVKLIDIPEMNYFAKDNKGEVCVKGPCVFKGYYKDPEKTAEVLDNDGWLHTGDVGRWTEHGCLQIIDRKKHIFKLSQGEYIAPERVEHVYAKSKFIAQIFVTGDSLKDTCVAIVIPDEEYLMNYCKVNKINGTFKDLCKNPEIRQLILRDMNQLDQKSDLFTFEKIKTIHLHSEPFSIDTGFLTATMKLKRNEIRIHFNSIIADLYNEEKNKRSKL